MTEADWLVCTDPIGMLRHVCFKEHQRKLGLVVCACWRMVWHLLSPSDQDRITAVENATDTVPISKAFQWSGILDEIDREMSETVWDFQTGQFHIHWTKETAQLAAVLLPGSNALNFWDWRPMEEEAERAKWQAADSREEVAKAWSEVRASQCQVFREIFGNPFRPVSIKPGILSWNDGMVVKLAQGIYEDRAFDRLPVLADALEDAGCDNADILAHLRGPGPHGRGCWPVDLLLGKE